MIIIKPKYFLIPIGGILWGATQAEFFFYLLTLPTPEPHIGNVFFKTANEVIAMVGGIFLIACAMDLFTKMNNQYKKQQTPNTLENDIVNLQKDKDQLLKWLDERDARLEKLIREEMMR